MSTTTKLSDLFGSMVFNEDTMKERLSSASYEAWKKCVTDGTSLDISTANEIAQAMKQWAVEKGYCKLKHCCYTSRNRITLSVAFCFHAWICTWRVNKCYDRSPEFFSLFHNTDCFSIPFR